MRQIPIVDLFAGPGGLSEGFSELRRSNGEPVFRVGLSVEKDPVAHRTLMLRAAFRSLRRDGRSDKYYDYVRGSLQRDVFLGDPRVAAAFKHAEREARCAELGKVSPTIVDGWIQNARKQASNGDWVLIGGPPCQAYSLAGRSRRTNDSSFAEDEKHFLYQEYLRIIAKHRPTIFVMENVKGLLSASHGGESMILRILEDLADPKRGLHYEIRSFVVPDGGAAFSPSDYVIRAEQYGVPQNRHRVILLGVLAGYTSSPNQLLQPSRVISVDEVIGLLPKIRSSLSDRPDSLNNWRSLFDDLVLRGWENPAKSRIEGAIDQAAVRARLLSSTGSAFIPCEDSSVRASMALNRWLVDHELGGVIQHQSRSHMASDLHRYLFAAAFAEVVQKAPKLPDFPRRLLPQHRNAKDTNAPFEDRFRVQVRFRPSTTVVSHIAKDGHYYIHPDPAQCRSLTVREAARLQTFPDNYFFEGNRTQQYTQVGNAVPPYLARQLASVVASLLGVAPSSIDRAET